MNIDEQYRARQRRLLPGLLRAYLALAGLLLLLGVGITAWFHELDQILRFHDTVPGGAFAKLGLLAVGMVFGWAVLARMGRIDARMHRRKITPAQFRAMIELAETSK